MTKHSIQLTQAQRRRLDQLVRSGLAPARKIMHAHVLLRADRSAQGPAWSDEQIREAFGISRTTMWRIRRRFLDHGLADALNRREQPDRPEKWRLDGEQEAHLIALTCSQTPHGQQRWTMRLLAEKMVALDYVEQVSHKTVWVTLKKARMANSPC